MGRIKSTMIKKAARQLLEGEHPFNNKFEHNKKLLGNRMPSKSIRNKIVGYIARIVKMQEAEKLRPKVKKVEEELPQYEM